MRQGSTAAEIERNGCGRRHRRQMYVPKYDDRPERSDDCRSQTVDRSHEKDAPDHAERPKHLKARPSSSSSNTNGRKFFRPCLTTNRSPVESVVAGHDVIVPHDLQRRTPRERGAI